MGESYPMNGGDGAYSYTKNSQYQKQASDSAKGMIHEAIIEKPGADILLSTSSTLRIADFGCSVGPNTFFAVRNLIEAVENKCSLQGHDSENIEFQVFFSDHAANDFNTLFASLPLDRNYNAAGVPGSFHGRLFPRASISLAHSSYAVHWLSKVPDAVSDCKSAAWNQGRIHYMSAPGDVVNAYSDQFERDMGVFLSSRAEEIVSGGLMFLILPGIREGLRLSDHPSCVFFDFLGSSLVDLANEGVIDKTKIDAFNLPIYFPTATEMAKLIEKDGCFSIERMEITNPRSGLDVQGMVMHLRAIVEGTFIKHFANFVVEKMFSKTLAKAEEVPQYLSEVADHNSTQLSLVLKRK